MLLKHFYKTNDKPLFLLGRTYQAKYVEHINGHWRALQSHCHQINKQTDHVIDALLYVVSPSVGIELHT